jgi:hypothetical protein
MSKKRTKLLNVVNDQNDPRGFHFEQSGKVIVDIQNKKNNDQNGQSEAKNDKHILIAAGK